MRFQYEGKTYAIEFQRDSEQAGERVRRYTTARLLLVEDGAAPIIVRQGKVACYYKDQFSYESGRKAALATALYDAPTLKGGEPIIGKRLPKEFKRTVWESYFRRGTKPTL